MAASPSCRRRRVAVTTSTGPSAFSNDLPSLLRNVWLQYALSLTRTIYRCQRLRLSINPTAGTGRSLRALTQLLCTERGAARQFSRAGETWRHVIFVPHCPATYQRPSRELYSRNKGIRLRIRSPHAARGGHDRIAVEPTLAPRAFRNFEFADATSSDTVSTAGPWTAFLKPTRKARTSRKARRPPGVRPYEKAKITTSIAIRRSLPNSIVRRRAAWIGPMVRGCRHMFCNTTSADAQDGITVRCSVAKFRRRIATGWCRRMS